MPHNRQLPRTLPPSCRRQRHWLPVPRMGHTCPRVAHPAMKHLLQTNHQSRNNPGQPMTLLSSLRNLSRLHPLRNPSQMRHYRDRTLISRTVSPRRNNFQLIHTRPTTRPLVTPMVSLPIPRHRMVTQLIHRRSLLILPVKLLSPLSRVFRLPAIRTPLEYRLQITVEYLLMIYRVTKTCLLKPSPI